MLATLCVRFEPIALPNADQTVWRGARRCDHTGEDRARTPPAAKPRDFHTCDDDDTRPASSRAMRDAAGSCFDASRAVRVWDGGGCRRGWKVRGLVCALRCAALVFCCVQGGTLRAG